MDSCQLYRQGVPTLLPLFYAVWEQLTQKILKVKCLQMQFPAFWRLNWVHARKCRVHSSFDLSSTQSMIYYLFTMLLNVVASFFGNKRVADLFRCSSVLIETSGHLKGVKKSWAVYFSKMCVMSGCLLRDIKLAGLHCWLWKQERWCEPCVLIGYLSWQNEPILPAWDYLPFPERKDFVLTIKWILYCPRLVNQDRSVLAMFFFYILWKRTWSCWSLSSHLTQYA